MNCAQMSNGNHVYMYINGLVQDCGISNVLAMEITI